MKNLFFTAMIIGMFTVGCNVFMIAGLLHQISQTIGQPIAATGQGITSFSLAYFLSPLLFSVIFSHKPVQLIMQSALAVFLVGNLITLISQTIVSFLIGRSLAGIGGGVFTTLCITSANHLAKSSVKGKVLSLVWSANSAGAIFGVPLGLYLSSIFNWQMSIVYSVILSLIAFIGFSFQKADIKLPVSPPSGDQFRLLANQKILSVVGITCFISMAGLGLYSYVAPLQSGSPNSLTLTLFTWGIGGFIGSSLVGIFIDRTKKPWD